MRKTTVYFLSREIKKIKNLRLDNLGTLIINVNLGDLVTEMSKISNEYKGSYWIIYEKDQLLFSSPELDTEEVQKTMIKTKVMLLSPEWQKIFCHPRHHGHQ